MANNYMEGSIKIYDRNISLNELIDEVKIINLIQPILTNAETSRIEDDVVVLNYNFQTNSNVNIYFNYLTLKKGCTYTLEVFCDGKITGGNYKVIYLVYGNKSYIAGYMSDTNITKYTFTPTEDAILNRIILDVSSGSNFTNFKMKFMLYKGSDEKTYNIQKSNFYDLNIISIFYPGQSFMIHEWYGGGMISSDEKYIIFTIPLPKSTRLTNGYSITTGYIIVSKPDGSRLIPNELITNYTMQNYYREFYITIRLYKESGWNISAHIPLAIKIDNLNISFN